MRLLAALIAGVRGAENGTARVRRRGTSTAVTVYQDFEGTQVQSATGALALDSNGACEAYVSELVDVTAYDSSGVSVRQWTEGDKADNVEVRSLGFTGTDYDSAASAVGNPTTLADIIDLWLTKNGAIDWQVEVNGVTSTIPVAIAGLSGIYFNVKDPTYGAVGDGSSDDSAAIQDAVTAAAGGGIVFFPFGDYNQGGTTITIAAGSKCSLMGCGAGGSRLISDGTVPNITIARAVVPPAGPLVIQGLSFMQSANGTSYNLNFTGTGYDVVVRDCYFGSLSYSNAACINLGVSAATARVLIQGCVFGVVGANQKAISAVNGYGYNVRIANNHFTVHAATYNGAVVSADSAIVSENIFNVSSVSGGTGYLIKTTAGGQAATDCLVVTGNRATGNNGGTVYAFGVTGAGRLVERGNAWDDCIASVTASGELPGTFYDGIYDARESRTVEYPSDSGTVIVDFNNYKTVMITRTVATDFAVNALAAPLYPGMQATLTVRNTNVAQIAAVSFGGNLEGSSWCVTPAVAASCSTHYTVDSRQMDDGSYRWVLTGGGRGSAF